MGVLEDRDLQRRLNNISARDAWQVAEEDNVDASNGLLVDIYIPPNGKTRHIEQVIIRVRLKAFRSYSAVTEASAVVVVTSESGGGTVTSTQNSTAGVSVPTGSYVLEVGPSVDSTLGAGGHGHGGVTGSTSGVDFSAHDHTISSTSDHSHSLRPHGHTITDPGHTHDFTDPVHTHDVEIPAHTHLVTAAITTGTTASNCTILINGNDRTTALTGAVTFNVDQDELDVTQYMEANGYNEIEIRSATLGRIRCTAFVNLYLNDR